MIKRSWKKKITFVMLLLLMGCNMVSNCVYASEPETDEQEKIIECNEIDEGMESEVETEIPVTDIEISDHGKELEVGNTLTLTATVLPTDATDSTVTYKSGNTAIATVNSSGEVKGISKGKVIIYVSAGEVTKEVSITVKVATKTINLNSNYLVLKADESYQLKVTVTPQEANQDITYKSTNPLIATVSNSGLVEAENTGSTTIIVSNGDITVAVSVIVNQSTIMQSEKTEELIQEEEQDNYAEIINVAQMDVVNMDMLHHLYSTGEVLQIVGNDYRIEISGRDIINYKNQFYTDIQLSKTTQGTSFHMNQGEYLCGKVTLYLENIEGKYLYLYNDSKEKYEQIEVKNMKEIQLTTPGKYLITEKRINQGKSVIKHMIIGSGALTVIGAGVYIGLKKRYWFW